MTKVIVMFPQIEIDYEMIGWRAKMQRQELGLSQLDVAELVGISPSFVGHIERGEKKASVATIVRLASALDTTTDYLLLGIKHTCEMEQCQLYNDIDGLLKSYGIARPEDEFF